MMRSFVQRTMYTLFSVSRILLCQLTHRRCRSYARKIEPRRHADDILGPIASVSTIACEYVRY